MSLMSSPRLSISTAVDALRRLLDALAAAVGLAILSPLLLGLGLWIKIDSRGPVFYRAQRIGRNGKPFRLFKFRTMVTGADRTGPGITIAGDRRVTNVGRFLRRTKLDELPQLLNVLRGEMSLVGPRPEDARYVALYSDDQRRILAYRPGITSAASLAYRNEEQLLQGQAWEIVYTAEVMPAKIAIDLAYMSQRTLASDVRLILSTVRAMRA